MHPSDNLLYNSNSTHRAQTSNDAEISTESDGGSNLDFWINPDTDVCRIGPKNVVDAFALACRHQSFRQVWYKSAVDCMRNVNKCPKIPYSTMVKKIKK